MDPSRHTYTSPRPSLSVNLDDMGAEGAAGALMNTVQAAAYLNLAPSTLEKDRCLGRLQIPYLKLGSKRVAYERRDLDQWKQARKRCSTSERAA
jgi:hypothetical protein